MPSPTVEGSVFFFFSSSRKVSVVLNVAGFQEERGPFTKYLKDMFIPLSLTGAFIWVKELLISGLPLKNS